MKITVINTGGTFNKRYNMLNGQLEIQKNNNSLEDILAWTFNLDFNIENIISKDSLDMTNEDREFLLKTINEDENENIIIIHGTDTLNETAKYLEGKVKDKKIVITAAMIPMSINKVEATMNFSSAYGFLQAKVKEGIYVALHGAVVEHDKIYKDKKKGKFLLKR